ncbi:LysR family transcriptional regulator [Pedobacter sp. MC2016-24]|uniref:LysR family transcriptional regulator n=1 Tax=Pedobacter sp. MC2016-24 TaxID=2780090 RepID=UPI0018815F8C|nr:LysR family transcriptional regulator [Pedobacter sp. MC2016-24]MBE9597966.1 LysR family transcriptional regulator [Pedobacter sp. MC2016-24]
MDLQQIKNFLKLAEELHFWNTASKMNITQSALSRQIQALENELDIKLFERNKRHVKLTTSGQFLRDKYAGMMEEFTFIHQFAKKVELGEYGTFRIAHPDSITFTILPEILKQISHQFPDLQLELIQLLYENEQEFLTEYKIDLAITRDMNSLEQICSRKIGSNTLSLVVPDNHCIRNFTDITPEHIRKEKFILPMAHQQSSYLKIVEQFFKLFDFDPKTHHRSDFGSTIMSLVSNGLGISILPTSFSKNTMSGIRFIELPIQSDLYMSWRSDDENPILKNILGIINSTLNLANPDLEKCDSISQ